MKWKISSASARGSSHVRSGKPNQDACEHGSGPKEGPLRAVLAVSDGHGGARHFRSDVGSRLAAHIAVVIAQEFVEAASQADPVAVFSEADAATLSQRIVDAWHAAVASDLDHNPFTPEELAGAEEAEGEAGKSSVMESPVLAYGATLLIAMAADTFVAYLQLGDGDILRVGREGETRKALPADERLIANQTTSLCQQDAVNEFRFAIERDQDQFPLMVLVSTDGYSNSFRDERGFLQTGRDYLKMVRESGLDGLSEELPGILEEASKQGSGDDITLGLLVSDRAYAEATPFVEAASVPALAATPIKPAKDRSQKVRVLSLLAIVLGGVFLAQHYARGLGARTGGRAAPVAASPAPKKSTNAPAEGRMYALQGLDGKTVQLEPGAVITNAELASLLTGKASTDDNSYAEVVAGEDGNWSLVNRSTEIWEIAGKDRKVKNGETLELAQDLRIVFRKGATGHIILMAHAPEH
jgi:hypothetical protein